MGKIERLKKFEDWKIRAQYILLQVILKELKIIYISVNSLKNA
jgi:hypothetical protein